MTKLKLELNLSNKTLNIDGNSVLLEDNLSNGEESEEGLHLYYGEKSDFDPINEGEKIYNFLQKYDLEEKIITSPTPLEVYDSKQYPAVTLLGDFNTYIKR